jgi:RNA polymerase sigma-70 factor (ECF subfamily)
MEPAQRPDLDGDLAVVRRAATDPRALETLYEREVDGLYAFVFFRVGRDSSLAEDVVQETFLAALDKLERFDPARGPFRSWLCQLSRNVARAHLRQRKRTEVLAMWDRIDGALLAMFERIDEELLAPEALEREETRDLVQLTLGHLPGNYRAVLERKYLDGATLEQIASEIAATEEAAKSLLARARRAFRETFQTLSRSFAEVEP